VEIVHGGHAGHATIARSIAANVEGAGRAFEQDTRGLAQHAPAAEHDEHRDQPGEQRIARVDPEQDSQRRQDGADRAERVRQYVRERGANVEVRLPAHEHERDQQVDDEAAHCGREHGRP